MRKAAPALDGNGPPKDDPLPRAIALTDNRLLSHYQEARRRLDRRIDDLDTIDIWKRDLQERIARAQLKFDLVDCLSDDYQLLRYEIDEFLAASHALAGRSPEAGS